MENLVFVACESSPITSPIADPDTLAALIRTPLTFSDFNDEVTWMMKADIFEIMLLDPSLHSNAVLDSFFDVEETNPLGELISWQTDLSTRFGTDKANKNLTQDTMSYLSTDIVYIDSILALSPNDSATWLALRELKADSLSNEFAEWLVLLDDEYTESMDTYSDIADDLNNLTTANDMEEYLKQALLLKTKYLLGSGFSSGDSAALVDLGQLCPWWGGRAIPIAHQLYATIADSLLVPSSDNCPSSSPFISRPGNSSTYSGEIFSIFPNPVIDQVEVHSETNMKELILSNLNMEPIQVFYPLKRIFTLSMSDQPAGIYLVTSITDKGSNTQRIILVK